MWEIIVGIWASITWLNILYRDSIHCEQQLVYVHFWYNFYHSVWKSQKKSHSTLRSKRAKLTFSSSLKMPKMVHCSHVTNPSLSKQVSTIKKYFYENRIFYHLFLLMYYLIFCLPLDMYFFQRLLEFVFALRSRKQDWFSWLWHST